MTYLVVVLSFITNQPSHFKTIKPLEAGNKQMFNWWTIILIPDEYSWDQQLSFLKNTCHKLLNSLLPYCLIICQQLQTRSFYDTNKAQSMVKTKDIPKIFSCHCGQGHGYFTMTTKVRVWSKQKMISPRYPLLLWSRPWLFYDDRLAQIIVATQAEDPEISRFCKIIISLRQQIITQPSNSKSILRTDHVSHHQACTEYY